MVNNLVGAVPGQKHDMLTAAPLQLSKKMIEKGSLTDPNKRLWAIVSERAESLATSTAQDDRLSHA
jgi:hypothetical protein